MSLTADPQAELHVGIYRTSSIGDVVLATACLDLLDQLPLSVMVTWFGRHPSLDLLGSAYPQVRCVEVDRHLPLKQVASPALCERLDFIVDLQANLRSHRLCDMVRRRFGRPTYRCEKHQWHRSRLVIESRIRGRRHHLPSQALEPVAPQFLAMVNVLREGLRRHLPDVAHLEKLEARPRLPIPKSQERTPWEREIGSESWLAVAAGAAHETKRAPAEVFAQILRRLDQKSLQVPIVFLGDEADRELANGVVDLIRWPRSVLNLCGKLSLWQTATTLSAASCLVSNDSALAHVAEAVGTPVATLFGPTVEGFGFGPQRTTSRAFSAPIGCRPCSKHGKSPCRFSDQLCFTSLPITQIADHLAATILTKRRLRGDVHD